MELFNSILNISDMTGISPDTILVIYGSAIWLYEVCVAAVHGFVMYGVFKIVEWSARKVKKKQACG